MTSEPNTKPIKLAIAALISFMLLAIIAGMIIPFNVEQSATVQTFSGEVSLLTASEAPNPLIPDTPATLAVDQTLHLQPASEASIMFTVNKGRALLSGPATLTLVESHRHATSLGHALDSLSRDYVLTLEQTQGTVRYIFVNSSPALDEINFTIQLSDGNYIPTSAEPCWTITIDTAGQSTIESISCQ